MSNTVKFYITVGLIGLIAIGGALLGRANADDQPLSYIMSKPSMHLIVFAQGRSFDEACALGKAARADAKTVEIALDSGSYRMCE